MSKLRSQRKVEPKRFTGSDLHPLSDEQRKILFPNGPVSLKKLKELKKNKIINNSTTE